MNKLIQLLEFLSFYKTKYEIKRNIIESMKLLLRQGSWLKYNFSTVNKTEYFPP